MWMTLAIGSAIVFGLGQVAMKSATMKSCLDQYVLLGLYSAGALFFFTLLRGKISLDHSHVFILFSIFIALGSYLGNWAVIKGLGIGSKSLTTPLLKLNVVLIILMSAFVYHEKFHYIKILSVIFLFLSILLINYNPDEKIKVKNAKWYAFLALGIVCLFLRDGGLKITQELGYNNKELLFFVFILCILFTVITMFIISRHKKERPKEFCMSNHRSKSIYYGLMAGICSALGLYWYSSALALGPASLSVLIFSSRTFVVVFFSYYLYKEGITKFQISALILLVTGLILAK